MVHVEKEKANIRERKVANYTYFVFVKTLITRII